MRYVILLGTDPSTLTSQVNALLELGWKPVGGVMLSQIYDKHDLDGYTNQWAQAMIKEEVSH